MVTKVHGKMLQIIGPRKMWKNLCKYKNCNYNFRCVNSSLKNFATMKNVFESKNEFPYSEQH